MKGLQNCKWLEVVAATSVIVVGCLSLNAADSLFKDPVISVTPRAIDFGSVPLKSTATNSILVENWGGGKLVGKATVARPFKIISGANYRLGSADAQVVTIIYTPNGAALDTNVVKFTGGGGTLVRVTGQGKISKEK